MQMRLAMIVASGFIITGCGVIGLKQYVPPTGPDVAEITFHNNAGRRFGMHIFEDATECQEKRAAIWVEPGSDKTLSVKSSAPTACLISYEEGRSTRTGPETESCMPVFSMSPQAGAHYRIQFSMLEASCRIDAEEESPFATAIKVDRRTFHRPATNSGPFCLPLATDAGQVDKQ